MNDMLNHPGPERLQAFVEEELGGGDRAVLSSHLATCARCRSEVEELRSLFELLAELPVLAPSPGFQDRVMTRVRVPNRWAATAGEKASEWLERVAPQTTRGWAVASGVFALPVLVTATLIWWVTSQPGVTAQGLWTYVSALGTEGLTAGWQWAWARMTTSTLAGWASGALDVAGSVGRGELGLAVVMFITFSAASIWILYQNLFRNEERRNDYASYVF